MHRITELPAWERLFKRIVWKQIGDLEGKKLRDSGEPSQGALAAAEYLYQKCEENIFNYGIMARFVQSIAHRSGFC